MPIKSNGLPFGNLAYIHTEEILQLPAYLTQNITCWLRHALLPLKQLATKNWRYTCPSNLKRVYQRDGNDDSIMLIALVKFQEQNRRVFSAEEK